MPGKHARLAPSASKRWMECTASPLYLAGLVTEGVIEESPDSVYSIEGTEAHDWAAKVLNNKNPLPLEKVPEDFRPHIAEYAQVCRECEHKAGEGSLRLVEQKVPLFYSPGENGTVDFGFVRLDKKGELEIIYVRDLKYGKGVPVDAEENTQMAIYGKSLIKDLESWWGPVPLHTPISIGIHQPRYVGDDSLKLWETTVGELNEFCEPINKTAKRISRAETLDDLEFKPSAEVCQFCPAKAICKARLAHAFEDFPVDVINLDALDAMPLPQIETVPPETLAAIWSRAKDIRKWLDGAEEYLTAMASAGKPVPGTKLVQGRDGNRAWKDVQTTEKFLTRYLGDGAYKPREILSPAKAEAALKEHIDKKPLEVHMTKLTERPAGKHVLALEDDKRPAVDSAMQFFDVITDEVEKE